MHTHIHFIPKTSEEDGLRIKWITKSIDSAELGEVAKRFVLRCIRTVEMGASTLIINNRLHRY